jgi:hypothetical protein
MPHMGIGLETWSKGADKARTIGVSKKLSASVNHVESINFICGMRKYGVAPDSDPRL